MKLLKILFVVLVFAFSNSSFCDTYTYHASLDVLENLAVKVIGMVALSYLGDIVGKGLLSSLNIFMKKALTTQDYNAASFAGILAAHTVDMAKRNDIDPVARAIALAFYGVPSFGLQ